MKSVFPALRARTQAAALSGVLLVLPALPVWGDVPVNPRSFEGTGLLSTEIDPEGNVSTHFYGEGSLRAVELPEGLSRSFLSSQTAALPLPGVATSPENPETAPVSGVAPAGGMSEQGGGSTRAESYVLGGDAQLVELRQGAILTTLLRDANGLVTRFVLPSGHRWDMTYDGRGNLASLRDVTIGGTTLLGYDPIHTLLSEILFPDGAALRMEYDAAGFPVVRTTPEGRRRSAEWNLAGQIDRVTSETGLVTSFTYDAAGNIETIRQGEAASERLLRLTREAGGRVTRVEAPEGRTFSYSYHPSGGIRSLTSSDGAVTDLEEDANGDVVALVRPGNARHAWSLDGLRRPANYTPPGQESIEYTYNVHSDPETMHAAGQSVAALTYNVRGQVLTGSETAPGLADLTTSWLYNDAATGLLVRADSSDGIRMTPAYRGEFVTRLTWSGPVAGAYTITIDSRRRILTGQVGNEAPIAFAYDRDNLLLAAGAMSITRDSQSGLVTGITLGSVAEAFEYNAFGELTAHTASANGTPFYTAVHTRDRLGRITETEETVEGVATLIAYQYDAGDRIARVHRNGAVSETYSYDERGNLLSDHLNGAYAYNLADQLLSAGGASFTYSATGERLTRARGGVTAVYRYSALSRLREVDPGNGRLVSYLHDPAGNRTARLLDGVRDQAWLCPDLNHPIAALDPAGQMAARYVYALDGQAPDYILQNAAAYRVVTDHVGSVRYVVDAASGEIVQRKSYDAYGRAVADSAPGFQPFGFAGGWTDPDTGLIRFAARDYDPEYRCWTTPDPITFASASLNNYVYVSGDPVNRVDPSGLNDEVKKTTQKVGKILDILPADDASWDSTSLTVTRGGETYRLERGSSVYLGDVITSSDTTEATIRFNIGGEAYFTASTTVEIVGQRDIENLSSIPFITTAGKMWAKFDKNGTQLQIKHSGGVIGVEG